MFQCDFSTQGSSSIQFHSLLVHTKIVLLYLGNWTAGWYVIPPHICYRYPTLQRCRITAGTLILTRITAKRETRKMHAKDKYGKNGGRLGDIPVRIETHVEKV